MVDRIVSTILSTADTGRMLMKKSRKDNFDHYWCRIMERGHECYEPFRHTHLLWMPYNEGVNLLPMVELFNAVQDILKVVIG